MVGHKESPWWGSSTTTRRRRREPFATSSPWPSRRWDIEGRTAVGYGVFGIPETFVMDQRGVVMAKLTGAVGPDALDQVLSQVVQGQSGATRNDQYHTGPDD